MRVTRNCSSRRWFGGVEGEKVIPYDARFVDILREISGNWTWEERTVQALSTKDGICISQE